MADGSRFSAHHYRVAPDRGRPFKVSIWRKKMIGRVTRCKRFIALSRLCLGIALLLLGGGKAYSDINKIPCQVSPSVKSSGVHLKIIESLIGPSNDQ